MRINSATGRGVRHFSWNVVYFLAAIVAWAQKHRFYSTDDVIYFLMFALREALHFKIFIPILFNVVNNLIILNNFCCCRELNEIIYLIKNKQWYLWAYIKVFCRTSKKQQKQDLHKSLKNYFFCCKCFVITKLKQKSKINAKIFQRIVCNYKS